MRPKACLPHLIFTAISRFSPFDGCESVDYNECALWCTFLHHNIHQKEKIALEIAAKVASVNG